MKNLLLSGISLTLLLGMSCKPKKNDTVTPNNGVQPITLDCDYFDKNPNAVLKDDPNAPVDYIVTCKMSIKDNVVVEPGTTIAFQEQAGFEVEESGSFSAIGSQSKPITFTGVRKVKGGWAGIMIYSTKLDNQISNAIIEYGGGDNFNSNRDSGNVIVFGGNLRFNNNRISNSASYGVHATNDESILSSFENNVFENNLKPLKLDINNLHTIATSNQFLNNTQNKIFAYIDGDINTHRTWNNLKIPYYFTTNLGLTACLIKADLTIAPGTVFEMGAKTYFTIRPEGSLKAVGTADNRIVFRGEKNEPGYWGSLYFNNSKSPLNELKYVDIEGAGYESSGVKGGIYLFADAQMNIDHTNFTNIRDCAIVGSLDALGNLIIGTNVNYNNTGGNVCPD